ncbi:STY4526/YPO1902 family pathogenicity island replication protein [Klebsiella pneumoniae]|nr:STY4526/YPO1902 family pathogenicity island replication protein [Klebsiella pneumoniae]MEC4376863.1 STY4526/YPO1902 family pathogenicity island replication protein [Klebsiella pneumoniae]
MALWKRWQEVKVDNLDSIQALEVMMQLTRERSLSLTVVWNLIRKWETR